MSKYKLLGWNVSYSETYLSNLPATSADATNEFKKMQDSFVFPKIVARTGGLGNDGNPIVSSGLKFPYDEFNLGWFDWEPFV